MRYRALGRSGLCLSEIGFGAWGIGGRTDGLTSYGDTDDETSLRALSAALDVGITFFDTSNVYGDGRSERLIGKAFATCRDRVVIATKAGLTSYDAPPDFEPDAIRRSLDGSLERLQSDYIDLLQLHNPPVALLAERPDIFETLEQLKAQGRIRAHGVSVKAPREGCQMLDDYSFDAVQANFNMMDIRALGDGLIDAAQRRGAGLIARTPLCFGFLSGAIKPDAVFPEGDHRRLWSRAQIERWCEGAYRLREAIPVPENQSQSLIALRFCLSYPGIASVIPGILTAQEAKENAAASDLGPLSPAALQAVSGVHEEMSFFVPAGK